MHLNVGEKHWVTLHTPTLCQIGHIKSFQSRKGDKMGGPYLPKVASHISLSSSLSSSSSSPLSL